MTTGEPIDPTPRPILEDPVTPILTPAGHDATVARHLSIFGMTAADLGPGCTPADVIALDYTPPGPGPAILVADLADRRVYLAKDTRGTVEARWEYPATPKPPPAVTPGTPPAAVLGEIQPGHTYAIGFPQGADVRDFIEHVRQLQETTGALLIVFGPAASLAEVTDHALTAAQAEIERLKVRLHLGDVGDAALQQQVRDLAAERDLAAAEAEDARDGGLGLAAELAEARAERDQLAARVHTLTGELHRERDLRGRDVTDLTAAQAEITRLHGVLRVPTIESVERQQADAAMLATLGAEVERLAAELASWQAAHRERGDEVERQQGLVGEALDLALRYLPPAAPPDPGRDPEGMAELLRIKNAAGLTS